MEESKEESLEEEEEEEKKEESSSRDLSVSKSHDGYSLKRS